MTIEDTDDEGIDNWNYRLIRHDDPTKPDGTWVGIHEVYYRDAQLWAHTEEPVAVVAENEEECQKQLMMMLRAFQQPTLSPGDFPEPEVGPSG